MSNDMSESPFWVACGYLPPAASFTAIGLYCLPYTSTPLTWFFRYCSAAFSIWASYAFVEAGFLITLYLSAIAAVCLKAAGFVIAIPWVFGQISLLISFICHS